MEYSPSEAAKLAGVNKSTVLRTIKSGKLSAARHPDGSFVIDASELARVYELHHLPRQVPRDASPAMPATRGAVGIEMAVLRTRLEAVETQLARERETVDDLCNRLDQEQEERRALQRQLTAQPVPQPTTEPPAVVEELRRRLEESEAHIRALVTTTPPPAPQAAQERRDEASVGAATPAAALRGLLGRLLGR